MSVEVERATIPCNVCGAHVSELRRGRCWGCYSRWVEARPVGRGAACLICFEKRRAQLKIMELHTRSVPICHGCGARILRLDQIPNTIEGVRQALKRDRREGDRRDDGLDRRIFPRERRVGERRGPPRIGDGAPVSPDADAFLAAELDDVIIELIEEDIEIIEQTTVNAKSHPDHPTD
jgi:hypothetical protein